MISGTRWESGALPVAVCMEFAGRGAIRSLGKPEKAGQQAMEFLLRDMRARIPTMCLPEGCCGFLSAAMDGRLRAQMMGEYTHIAGSHGCVKIGRTGSFCGFPVRPFYFEDLLIKVKS